MAVFYLLVADDQRDICKLLEFSVRLVYKDQVRVKRTETVPDLLACLGPGEPRPDLLLLAYQLRPCPYKAPDVLTWLDEQAHLDGLPVAVWSTLPDEAESSNCRRLGAQRFIHKADATLDMVWFVKSLVEARTLYK